MEQAQEFVDGALGPDITPGGGGAGGLNPPASDAGEHDAGSLSLSFTSDEPLRVLGVRAACFGEGTAELSQWMGRSAERSESEPNRIDCDGTEHTFMLPHPVDDVPEYGADARLVDGPGAALGLVIMAEAMDK